MSWNSVVNAASYAVYKDNILYKDGVLNSVLNISNLNQNTSYSMHVSAINTSGESVKSEYLTVKTFLDTLVTTFAGNSTAGYLDGIGTSALFNQPFSIAIDANGNLYVGDWQNHRIRKISSSGIVSTFAGSGIRGYANGVSNTARFDGPLGITVDSQGYVYVADTGNNCIRKISPDGIVSTLAGSDSGFADGVGTVAKFKNPYGIDIDSQGNIYVADTANNRIRKISPDGFVSTIAGSSYGFADGEATVAKFSTPYDVAVDDNGNIFVADYANHRIRKISREGIVSTFAGSASFGSIDGIGAEAQFYSPTGITQDINGNIYVSVYSSSSVRKITPSGLVSSLVTGYSQGYADGPGYQAMLNFPRGIAVDNLGQVFVADTRNNRIRKVVSN